MAHPNAFALKNSGLNPFLFADVGNEQNGSPLTILSILARLGRDPWAEAARWATLPRGDAVDCLEQSMARMPLMAQAVADAHATAMRLVLLLPRSTGGPEPQPGVGTPASTMPKWAPMAIFYFALAIGAGLNMMLMAKPSEKTPVPVAQTVAPPPQVPTSH